MENNFKNSLDNAKTLYTKKQYKESEQEFRRLIEADYETAKCYYYLGLINFNLNNRGNAEKNFIKSIEIDPANYDAFFLLGIIFEQKGKKDSAIYYYSKTMEINSRHVQAEKALEKLIEQGPQKIVNINEVPEPQPITNFIQNDSEPFLGDLFDELKKSKDSSSIAAVNLIRKLTIKKRLRLSAYLGSLFIIPFVGFVVYNVINNLTHFFYLAPVFFLGIYLLYLIYKIIWIKSYVVNINRGLIRIEKGVFFRSTNNLNIHTTTNFEIDQNFINRITGDGTLKFNNPESIMSSSGDKIKIKGLFNIKQLNEIALDLRSLHYHLRNSPIFRTGGIA